MVDSERDRPRVGRDAVRRQTQSLGFLVAIGLALLLTLGFARQALRNHAEGGVPCAPERINLNDAPLASLLRLPGVGLTRARAIVDYRGRPGGEAEQGSVFAGREDIRRVKGFGPATVEEILPWLQFPPAPEGNDPPTPGGPNP